MASTPPPMGQGRARQGCSLMLGACAVALVTGCALPGPAQQSSYGVEVEPVLQVRQPLGTIASQYAAGRIDLGEGRYETAILRFRQALQLDPGFAAAYNGLGIAYGSTGRFELAAQAFHAALASGPSSAPVLNNLGFAQLEAGRLDAARESLRRALELDPANAGATANMRLLEQMATSREHEAQSGIVLPVASVDPALPPLAAARSLFAQPLPVSHADLITAIAQTRAAKVLSEAPNPRAYEIVVARASDTTLIEVESNVYEVHFGVRPASPAVESAAARGPSASAPGSVSLPASRTVSASPWQSVEPVALSAPFASGWFAVRATAARQQPGTADVIVNAIRAPTAAPPLPHAQQAP